MKECVDVCFVSQVKALFSSLLPKSAGRISVVIKSHHSTPSLFNLNKASHHPQRYRCTELKSINGCGTEMFVSGLQWSGNSAARSHNVAELVEDHNGETGRRVVRAAALAASGNATIRPR